LIGAIDAPKPDEATTSWITPLERETLIALGKVRKLAPQLFSADQVQAYKHLVKMLYRTPQSRYFHVWNKTTQQGGAPNVLAKYKRRVYAYYDDLLTVMTTVPPPIAAQLHTDDAFLLTHSRALRGRTSQRTTSVLMIGQEHPGSTPIIDATQAVYAAIHAKLPDSDYPDMKMQGESYSHTEQYDVPTPWVRYDEVKGHLIVCINIDGVKTVAIIVEIWK